MKNSIASSSDPKDKRPMTQDDLDNLEKLSRENKRVRRIKEEAIMLGISFEKYKAMVDDDEHLFEKQFTEDEKLAKILSQFLTDEESILVNRQIKEDEEFAKALAQQEEDNPLKRERSIFITSSGEEEEVDGKEDSNVQLLKKRNRDFAGGSNMSESSSDRSFNS